MSTLTARVGFARRIGSRIARATNSTVECLERRVLMSGSLPASVQASSDAEYTITGDAASGFSVTFSAGTFSLGANEGSSGGAWQNLSLTLTGTADVRFNAQQTFNSLTLSGAANAVVGSSGGGTGDNLMIVGSGGFSMPDDPATGKPTATLDLMDNDMILLGAGATELPVLQAMLMSGGSTSGTGLRSSDAAASATTSKMALGYGVDGAGFDFTSVDGQPVSSGDVVVKYTLAGDVDLSGKVDDADYSVFRNSYGKSGQSWTTGDFTYDSETDGADYTWLSGNYGRSIMGPAVERTLSPGRVLISPMEGRPFTGAVASFYDTLNTPANPTTPASYAASVSWGDGNFVNAEITSDGLSDGGYVVTAASPSAVTNPGALITTIIQYSAGSGSASQAHAALLSPPLEITPAVSRLVAVPLSIGQISLNWDLNASDAGAVEIDRADDGGTFVAVTTVPGNATRFIDNTVSDGHSYNYEIRALRATPVDPSAFAGPAYATTQTVEGLSATSVSPSEIDLAWTALERNATAIEVERSTDDINFSQEATLPASATTFNDKNLIEASRYYYELKAVYGSIESAPSLDADTYTNPTAPSGLTATMKSADGISEVDLSWTYHSRGASVVDIMRNDSSDGTWDLGNVDPSVTTFTDLYAPAGQVCTYSVVAITPNSDYSPTSTSAASTATVTTPVASVTELVQDPGQPLTYYPTEVSLTWKTNVPDATGIVIYISTDGQSYSLLTQTPLAADATSFRATNLAPGTRYYFSVGAIGSPSAPNPWFAQNTADTDPSTPVLSATVTGWSVILNWTGNFVPNTEFTVRGTDNPWTSWEITDSTTWTDYPFSNGTYTYSVQAGYPLDFAKSPTSNSVTVVFNKST